MSTSKISTQLKQNTETKESLCRYTHKETKERKIRQHYEPSFFVMFFVLLYLFFFLDDTDNSDSRVRKPLDNEQEMKMQKMKSEKTKRELHVQELDYKIHILEQEN